MEKCSVCQHYLFYSDDYDSFYCKECDEWKEQKCSDPICEFCLVRPEKPSSKTVVIYSEGRK